MSDVGDRKSSRTGLLLAALLGLVLVGGFVWLIVRAQALPTGVVPPVWDREACAHCKMHVGEPRFAAQLQLEDGRVLNFDDPGCLMLHLGEERGAVRAMYFHHVREDRWLSADDVGFVAIDPTPMGFGLGAVERSEAHAISLAAARNKVAGGATGHP